MATTLTLKNIPDDVYERLKGLLDVERAYPLIDESFRDGWEAPGMQDYDRYEDLKKA